MKKDDLLEWVVRILLIIFYPLWLILGLLECMDWNNFKEGALIPFRRWGNRRS